MTKVCFFFIDFLISQSAKHKIIEHSLTLLTIVYLNKTGKLFLYVHVLFIYPQFLEPSIYPLLLQVGMRLLNVQTTELS